MIYLEGTSELIRASDGTITGRFGTLQDVTVRKQAEEAIARTNEQLEKIVTERTVRLVLKRPSDLVLRALCDLVQLRHPTLLRHSWACY